MSYARTRDQLNGDVQKRQRFAAIGTSLKHSGHCLIAGSGGAAPRLARATRVFTGTITKKYTAIAISRNDTSALMNSPMRNLLPLIVNVIAEKSGTCTIAAMSGVSRSLTSAATTVPNAPPMTTATAR